jgi:hypothetical protein
MELGTTAKSALLDRPKAAADRGEFVDRQFTFRVNDRFSVKLHRSEG